MYQENRPELPVLPSGIDDKTRPALPITEVSIDAGHDPYDASCYCGSPVRLAYQPHEFWGRKLIVLATLPVYQCIDDRCGLVQPDIYGCLEFSKKTLVLIRPTRDRDAISFLSQEIRITRRHMKAWGLS